MPEQSPTFRMRPATIADITTICHHRVAMFTHMGRVDDTIAEELATANAAYLRDAIPSGEYLGWLAETDGHDVAAGVGVQRRRVLPFPRTHAGGRKDVAGGQQAIVVNVYTEPHFRRRGLARLLMREVLDWARATGIESVVLHAAPDGRPLYQELGFIDTNEMRFAGELP